MDYITRKEFRDALLTLYKELHQQTKNNRCSNESQTANKKSTVPPVTKLDSVSSIETRKPETEKKSDSKYHCWSLAAQWSTFFIVAIYTTIAALQWCAMRDQLTELQNENRPWMGISRPIIVETIPIVEPSRIYIKLAMWAKNYGKTPAFDVAVKALPMFDDKEWESLSDASCKLVDDDVRAEVGSYTFPDRELILSPEVNSESSHKETTTIYVAGCIGYLDEGRKIIHHTRFCAQANNAY